MSTQMLTDAEILAMPLGTLYGGAPASQRPRAFGAPPLGPITLTAPMPRVKTRAAAQ